jgi:peptide/nickel transport system permease protein
MVCLIPGSELLKDRTLRPATGAPGRLKWVLSGRGLAGKLAFGVFSAIVLLFVVFAVAPEVIAPYDPTVNNLRLRHAPPGFVDTQGNRYLLGTDHLGRDVLSRVIWGSRASMAVGFTGLVLGGTVGTFIGLLAGFRGGWLDAIAMRVVDAYLSFPYILIAIVWASLVGTDLGNLILVVALRGWVEFARLTRNQTVAVKGREYVTSARAVGVGDSWIMVRYILPNIMSSLLVLSSYQLGRLILLEGTLSFLGLGIRPPTPAWGTMLADARNYITTAWWTIVFPGIALSAVVLAVSFLGDSLRDYLDPTMRRRV